MDLKDKKKLCLLTSLPTFSNLPYYEYKLILPYFVFYLYTQDYNMLFYFRAIYNIYLNYNLYYSQYAIFETLTVRETNLLSYSLQHFPQIGGLYSKFACITKLKI